MRLIDADNFKHFLQTLVDAGAPYESVIELLDKQPAAYDVDKVVEQLEEQIAEAEKVIVNPPHDKLDKIANDTAEAFIESYKDAVEIVKAGGANE